MANLQVVARLKLHDYLLGLRLDFYLHFSFEIGG